jgi:hypothetical protein
MLLASDMPIDPPVLRAMLIKAEAISVLLWGISANDAVMIGMKTNGKTDAQQHARHGEESEVDLAVDPSHIEHRQRADCGV